MGKRKQAQDPTVFQISIFDYFAYLDSVEEDAAIEVAPGSIEGPERWVWSEEESKMLHVGLLEDSLIKLKNGKTAEETKREILHWINKPLKAEAEVFSFQACCILAGLSAEELRNQLLYLLQNRSKLQ